MIGLAFVYRPGVRWLVVIAAVSCSGAPAPEPAPATGAEIGAATAAAAETETAKRGLACPFNPEHTELFPAFEYLWPDCPCQVPAPEVGRCTAETALCEIDLEFPETGDFTRYRYYYNDSMILERAEAFDRGGGPQHEWDQRCVLDGDRPLNCVVQDERVEYRYGRHRRIDQAIVDGAITRFRYDDRGRLAGYCRQARPATCVEFDHDGRGRISRERHRPAAGGAYDLVYRYGADGRLVAIEQPGDNGRRWQLSRRGGRVVEIRHSAPGEDPERVVRETRTHDALGRVVELVRYGPRGVSSRSRYRYDCD